VVKILSSVSMDNDSVEGQPLSLGFCKKCMSNQPRGTSLKP
jgi:hypothetical protein